MKTHVKIIIFLLLTTITLLVIDISTGIWYWNGLNLKFDSEAFNNIATPIASIVTFIVVVFALQVSKKQNRLNFGASVKPFFTGRIKALKQNVEDNFADDTSLKVFLDNNGDYKGFKRFNSVFDAFVFLEEDLDYISDMQEFEKTKSVKDNKYYHSRSYFKILFHLNGWAINDGGFPFAEIKDLFIQIQKSDLIQDDKDFLYREIRYELLSDYINVVKYERKSYISPRFPVLYSGTNSQMSHLYETEFGKLYDWIKQNISVFELN